MQEQAGGSTIQGEEKGVHHDAGGEDSRERWLDHRDEESTREEYRFGAKT